MKNYLVISGLLALLGTSAALADNPSWQEQQIRNKERERQMMQAQGQQGYTPQGLTGQAQQAARWEREWTEQHPGEPMPSFGKLEKMHRGEIIQGINSTWDQTRQNRQNELRNNYLLSRRNQEQKLAAQHITWSPQQWSNWDTQYRQQMQQNAKDYLEGVRQAGEIWQYQEDERKRRETYGY